MRQQTESCVPAQAGNSLGASLEAGDRAATNGVRSSSTGPTVQLPSSRQGTARLIQGENRTSRAGLRPNTQLAQHGPNHFLMRIEA